MISQSPPFPLVHALQVHKQLAVLRLPIGGAVQVWRADALGQRVVAGVGEVAAGMSLTCGRVSFCDGVVGGDPHGGGVGDGRHGGLFAFLLLPVDDEEEEEEENQQHQHDDPGDGADLIRVHLHGCAGQTVQAADHDHACLVTASALPARVTVTRPGHVIAGGVIEAVTHLTAAVTIGTSRTLLFTVSSHESRPTRALS